MVIKKISLENYRSHKNTSIELSNGINLILGVNGSGKSSILEAIGKVIFDVNDRTGKQIGKTFIRHGESSAKVEIEFLANDGRMYKITNKFYSKKSTSQILKDLETAEEYRGDIREKLNELCGIKKDYTKIYDNIIIAMQNEFINIFKESPKDREKVFNKVFNTGIYGEICETYLKNIVGKYTKEIESFEIEKNIISNNLADENLILENLKNEILQKENLETKLGILEKEQKKIKNEISNFEKIQRELDDVSKNFDVKIQNIKEQKENLKDKIKNAKKAKFSRILVEKNRENFYQYQILGENLEKERKILDNLKKIDENNFKLIQKNEKLSWEISKNKEQIEKENLEVFTKNLEKENLNKEILNSQEQEKELKTNIEKFKVEAIKIEIIEQEKAALEKEKYSFEKKLKDDKKLLEKRQEEVSFGSREELENQLLKIENMKEKMEEISKETVILKEKIKALEEAKEKLADKICPYLKETCENVKSKDIGNYFAEKISENKVVVEKLKEEYKLLKSRIANEEILRKNLRDREYLEKEIKSLFDNLEKNELFIENLVLKLQNKDLEIEKILNAMNFKTIDELDKKMNDSFIALSKLNLDEKRNTLKSLEINLSSLKENISLLISLNEKNLEEIEENKINIDETVTEKIKMLKEEIAKSEEKQKLLQFSYNTYLENINLSDSLEDILEKINTNIKFIQNLKSEKNMINFKKNILEKEILEIDIEKLRETQEKINLEFLEKNKIYGAFKEKIKNLEMNLEKIKLEKEKIESLKTSLKKLENKLYKTKNIRENIQKMALQISKYMLDNISLVATSNFNKITARAERILWTNETYLENGKEKENKYAVYLVGENSKTAFENLSGGEQVAVAIALRETMAEFFSNSRFIILDEPTNNLDKERKKLLAEYMGEMLNNLDQSIIVTHDNTFREMAERIIEL